MRHRSVKIPRLRVHYVSSLALLGLALAVAAPSAQALPGRDEHAPRDQFRDFDRYLDHHPGVREQLYEHPGLIENEEWREHQPGLNKFLRNHPGVREELRENPQAFLWRERRFDREDDRWRDHDDRWRDRDEHPDRY